MNANDLPLPYFDFYANWHRVLHAWNSDSVQHALALDIGHASQLGFFRTYKLGDPLWKESRTHYWTTRLTRQALQKMEDEHYYKHFERSMANAGIRYCSRDQMKLACNAACFKHVYKECIPDPTCIHSFYFPEGSFLLPFTIKTLAASLFPDDTFTIIYHRGKKKLFSENLKCIVDFFDYYEQHFASQSDLRKPI